MNEFANEVACRNCVGGEWVCENHADRPWDGTSNSDLACGCGAGMPCGACNLEAAADGYVFRERDAIIAWLRSHEGLGDRGKWLIVAAGEIERGAYRDRGSSPDRAETGTGSGSEAPRAPVPEGQSPND